MPDAELLTPLDRFRNDRGELTAVERFAHRDDAQLLDEAPFSVGSRSRYRDLLPTTGPGPGEQYAFDVDLDACSGCKACVSACHSLNGLDPTETWRSVGLLHGIDAATPVLHTVTTACHHCVDPACLNGCPVDAYEKDPVTGIVAHLDDQCIGCQYCTLMCPYEVPVYDAGRGIVRKCDLCADRLAEGEAPACVQGCPTDAIAVTVVSTAELVAQARTTSGVPAQLVPSLVPTAPPSSITVPTTRYRSVEPLPETLVAADRFSLQPAHGHTPLAVMLVLTQLAVGVAVLAFVLGDRLAATRGWSAGITLAVGVVALAASVGHLGRPLLAWRAVLGLRHSWLSREIVAFGLFAALAALHAASTVAVAAPPWLTRGLGASVVIAGSAGVACSVLLYAATRRRWWRGPRLAVLFSASALVTASAALLVVVTVAAASDRAALTAVRPLIALLVVTTVVKLAVESIVLRHRHADRRARPGRPLDPATLELHRTARLLTDDLAPMVGRRVAAGLAGGVLVPLVLLAVTSPSGPPSVAVAVGCSVVALVLVVAAELTERRLFFLAMSGPRMPGVLR